MYKYVIFIIIMNQWKINRLIIALDMSDSVLFNSSSIAENLLTTLWTWTRLLSVPTVNTCASNSLKWIPHIPLLHHQKSYLSFSLCLFFRPTILYFHVFCKAICAPLQILAKTQKHESEPSEVRPPQASSSETWTPTLTAAATSPPCVQALRSEAHRTFLLLQCSCCKWSPVQ